MSANLPSNEQPQQNNNLRKSDSGTVAGIVIVLLGVFFMLRSFGVLDWDFNWWAFFLMIPAAYIALHAWREYQSNGKQLTRVIRNKLLGSVFILTIAVTLLIGMDWEFTWPLFMILGGIALMLNALAPNNP
jgi:peptidoglycan/LPS O-acetylase OafA/YrhL